MNTVAYINQLCQPKKLRSKTGDIFPNSLTVGYNVSPHAGLLWHCHTGGRNRGGVGVHGYKGGWVFAAYLVPFPLYPRP